MKQHTRDPPELVKNRKELVEEMQDTYGYIFCQSCEKSRAYKFEVHHIIFRSEAPNHPRLHDKINLLIVCTDCHTVSNDSFHSNKSKRNELVRSRGLDKIFSINFI